MPLTVEQIASYRDSWANKPKAQVAEEIASLSMETKRIPDPYTFVYNIDGKLISPQTGKPIEDSIDKISPLGALEYEGFQTIEKFGWENKVGTIVWISPPHPLRSNSTKVVVTQISDNPPRLFNRAIMLDLDLEDCKRLGNKLDEDFVYTNSDQLIKRPIFIPGEFDFYLLPDQRQIGMIKKGEDIKAKQEALVLGRIASEDLLNLPTLQKEKVIFGNFDTSCPPTAFQVFAGEKRILCCTCPFCGKEVMAEIYDGKIHCTNPECKKEANWLN